VRAVKLESPCTILLKILSTSGKLGFINPARSLT
jgi:hypothetical protein